MRLEDRLRLGLRVRKARIAKGLSIASLGRLSGHSGRYVLDLELGRVDPRVGDLADLAGVLGVKLYALLSQPSVTSGAETRTLDSREEQETKRREFLAMLAAAGTGILDVERLAAPVVDASYLRDAEAVTTALVGQWYSAQPAILLPPVLAHLSALRGALPGPPALENLAGRTALLAAHLFSKLKRLGDARAHYALAESLSQDADDAHLHGLALVLRSGLHTWRREISPNESVTRREFDGNRRALALLNEAVMIAGDGAPPLLRVVALARRAEELAATGDESGCLRDLSAAEAALRPTGDHWYGARDAAELAAVRGACELLLGRHRDAAATLGWTLERMDPSAVNWRAVVAADRDAALAQL